MTHLTECKKIAIEAVKKAEESINYYFDHLPPIEKKVDLSPVTQADREAEEIIVETIRKKFPDHGFLGEEFGTNNETAEFVWIIDPIDGTKNYVHHIDFFGTVLGLKHQGKIVLGISNMPRLNEFLFASEEEATTLNGQPTHVSEIQDLSEAYVTIGGFRRLKEKPYFTAVTTIEEKAFSMRGYGDVHGYHLVTTGRADVMFEPSVKPWDVSAYQILLKQAGGKYSNFEGDESALGPTSLATNGLLHPQLVNIFQSAKV